VKSAACGLPFDVRRTVLQNEPDWPFLQNELPAGRVGLRPPGQISNLISDLPHVMQRLQNEPDPVGQHDTSGVTIMCQIFS
jgi:hypothetical protein